MTLSFSIFPKVSFIRFACSEDWRAIRLLQLRATETSRVGLGFDRRFGHREFAATIRILAPINLALFGHWPLRGHRV
jgi:hypothetical protein